MWYPIHLHHKSTHILTMYDAQNGKLLWHAPFGKGHWESSLIFSGSSRLLYYYTNYSPIKKGTRYHPHIYALNPDDGHNIRELDNEYSAHIASKLALSQDGQLLASVGRNIGFRRICSRIASVWKRLTCVWEPVPPGPVRPTSRA